MFTLNALKAAAFVTGLTFTIPASADKTLEDRDNAFEHDRACILAMAGDFKVLFEFNETLTLDPDSKPSKRELSRAHETVQVIEDRGDFIQLQHLLVSVDGDGKHHVVKHWRQDWAYEPSHMLVYRGRGDWEKASLSRDERHGAWTQTVYQVDDSPRYAGFGTWQHIGEYSYWQSNETWRPLPRRELKIRDDYDVLVGINRHSLTPEGWAHEQDNYKLALDPAGNRVLARETGLNTYARTTEFDFSAAHTYWQNTEAFWKTVRDQWATALADSPALHIAEQSEEKKTLHWVVMSIGNDLNAGKIGSSSEAVESFQAAFADYVEPIQKGQSD